MGRSYSIAVMAEPHHGASHVEPNRDPGTEVCCLGLTKMSAFFCERWVYLTRQKGRNVELMFVPEERLPPVVKLKTFTKYAKLCVELAVYFTGLLLTR